MQRVQSYRDLGPYLGLNYFNKVSIPLLEIKSAGIGKKLVLSNLGPVDVFLR